MTKPAEVVRSWFAKPKPKCVSSSARLMQGWQSYLESDLSQVNYSQARIDPRLEISAARAAATGGYLVLASRNDSKESLDAFRNMPLEPGQIMQIEPGFEFTPWRMHEDPNCLYCKRPAHPTDRDCISCGAPIQPR